MSQYAGLAGAGAGDALCDLRSDTVTRPDAGMMRAIQSAELGDDVYGEDPQVNRLEAALAQRLGEAAALFLPTGTMSNLVGLLAHCQRGEEIITGADQHCLLYPSDTAEE